jgi:hypothetical protein
MADDAILRRNQVGTVFHLAPIPPEPEATRRISAGPVTVGVEHRHLGADHGISLHVFDTATGAEHLRFDCFDQEPHYHYITPARADREVTNCVVPIDEVALGPALPWALAAIRDRLAPMLRQAGAGDLAAAIDRVALVEGLKEVRKQARQPVPPAREL